MRDYFQPWRRRLGVAMLFVCVAMTTALIVSLTHTVQFDLASKDLRGVRIVCDSGYLSVACYQIFRLPPMTVPTGELFYFQIERRHKIPFEDRQPSSLQWVLDSRFVGYAWENEFAGRGFVVHVSILLVLVIGIGCSAWLLFRPIRLQTKPAGLASK